MKPNRTTARRKKTAVRPAARCTVCGAESKPEGSSRIQSITHEKTCPERRDVFTETTVALLTQIFLAAESNGYCYDVLDQRAIERGEEDRSSAFLGLDETAGHEAWCLIVDAHGTPVANVPSDLAHEMIEQWNGLSDAGRWTLPFRTLAEKSRPRIPDPTRR